MSILRLNTIIHFFRATLIPNFLYFSIGILGIYSGFTSVLFFNLDSIAGFGHSLLIPPSDIATASELIPPQITISEIMSCPLSSGKEWIELSRNKVSLPNQVQLSQDYSLTGYRLEDDKSTIWTGNAVTPVSFNQNQELAQIELNKQYLNNTGDSLKLWSPSGELLDEAIIPACKENGHSWSFQDGEWLSGTPSPGEQNPSIPIPTPTPSPSPTPAPTVSPTPSASPTPMTTPTVTPQPTASPVSSPAASQQSTETTLSSTSKSELKSAIIDPTYVQKIFLTTDRHENLLTTQSATIADSSSEVGSVLSSSNKSDKKNDLDQEKAAELNATKNLQPSIYHAPLPERSPSTYISAILGGVLLTTSGGVHSIYTQHSNGKQKKQDQNSS